jgi:hypothetical protein
MIGWLLLRTITPLTYRLSSPAGLGLTAISPAASFPVWCSVLLAKFHLSKLNEIFEDGLAHFVLIFVSIRMGHANNMFCALCEK